MTLTATTPADIWELEGLDGLPDVRVPEASSVAMPTSADGLSLEQLREGVQQFAAYTAFAATVLSGEEAKEEYLSDLFEHKVGLASAQFRTSNPDAVKKLTVDGVRALVIDADPALDTMAEDLRRTRALIKRHERLYDAYKFAYQGYSRHIEAMRIESDQSKQR